MATATPAPSRSTHAIGGTRGPSRRPRRSRPLAPPPASTVGGTGRGRKRPRAQRHRAAAANGPSPVAAAEQRGVHQQRVQLVQADPVPPAVGQRPRLVVGREDVVEVRQTEQREHREVGLPVAAVRRRVDEHRARRPTTARCPPTGPRAAGLPARAGSPSAPSASRAQTRSTRRRRRHPPHRRPGRSQVRREPGLGVERPQPRPSSTGRCGSGSVAMKPSPGQPAGGAPWCGAPDRCIAARARPSCWRASPWSGVPRRPAPA